MSDESRGWRIDGPAARHPDPDTLLFQLDFGKSGFVQEIGKVADQPEIRLVR